MLASCSTTVKGTAVSVFDDPFKVAGMPAVDGPTGLRPVPEAPSRDVENSDGGNPPWEVSPQFPDSGGCHAEG